MALAKVSGTRIRGGRYFYNIAIPADLRPLYGDKDRLTDAIGTADPRQAADAVTTAKAKLIDQKKDLAARADLSALIDALPQEQRALFDAAGGLEGLRKEYEASKVALKFMEGDIPPDEATPTLDADIRDAEDAVARKVILDHARQEAKTLNAIGETVKVPGGAFDTLEDIAERFAVAKNRTVQNTQSLRYTMRRWREFHGDVKLTDLTREMLWQFDEAAHFLPTSSKKDIRSLPMRRAIALAKRDGLATVSFKARQRLIMDLKAVMAWGIDKGLIPMPYDPWAGYKMDKPKVGNAAKKKAGRKAFTPDEVWQILDHVQATFDPDTLDYWLPVLGAHTGARREELAQLRIADIENVAGILCMHITDEDEAQKVKNTHSIRTVPVPPAVLALGFAGFVERRRQAGGHFLFLEDYRDKRHRVTRQEPRPDSRGRLSEEYGRRFARKVLEPLGIKKTGQAFHALRHSWTDACRRAQIDMEVRRAIAGRIDDGDLAEAGYGDDELIPIKLEALKKMEPYICE